MKKLKKEKYLINNLCKKMHDYEHELFPNKEDSNPALELTEEQRKSLLRSVFDQLCYCKGIEGDYDDMFVDENGHKRPKKYFKSKTVSLELLMEDIIPYAINCNHIR